jgi:MYXO-CTERM domain-containing protein
VASAAGGMSTTPSGGMMNMGSTGGRSMTGMGGRAMGSGGSSQGGMAPASGGRASNPGGRSAVGGSSGSGDVMPVDPAAPPEAGGCGCRVVTSSPSGGGTASLLATLGLAALWLLRRARAAA